MAHTVPHPTQLTVHRQSRDLEIAFDDGAVFRLPFELLRVYSPSAEVRGHGPGQETLQTGKRDVLINQLESVGNYAVQPTFSDGHDTGIFTWEYLYFLGSEQSQLWSDYLERLAAAQVDRDAAMVTADAPSSGGCGHGAHHGH
ncbi:MAG: gamma-butyrobetaine hydroxylase family protein [Thiomonas sp.]